MENNNVMPKKHHMEFSGDLGSNSLQNKCSLSDTEGANPKHFHQSRPCEQHALSGQTPDFAR